MTAPTPVDAISVGAHVLSIRSMAAFHRTNKIDLPLADVLDSHADIISKLGNALAAVTAELDQAREELSKARDDSEIWMNCHKEARQILADAPHGKDCASVYEYSYPCNCWKAGL